MDHFTLQSPYFHIVVLLLCFTLFKISMSSIHSNPSTMPVIEVQEGSACFLINDAS